MSGEGTAPEAGSENGMDAQTGRVQVIGQYIKDLSFENPSAPGNLTARPQIELSVLNGQCLDRRIPDFETMRKQVAAWEDDRNNRPSKIRWQFSTTNARIKLKRLYPKL